MRLIDMFNKQVKQIEVNNKAAREGKPLFLPFSKDFARLKSIITGFIRKQFYIITANSGVGKSKFIRKFFIQQPIQYCMANPHVDVEIIYNTLEDSEEEVICGMILQMLKEEGHDTLNFYKLNGYTEGESLSPELIEHIKTYSPYFEKLSKYLRITRIGNPYGCYKAVRDLCRKQGTFYDKKGNVIDTKRNEETFNWKNQRWASWKPDNPNKFYIFIHDRAWLLSKEGDKNKYDTVLHFTDYYMRQMMNLKLGWITALVQQQVSSKEAIEVNMRGDTVEQKLEPSLDGLAFVKTTQQAATIVLGIFAPNRYKIPNHHGYDITKLDDFYRTIHLLKHRNGVSSKTFPMFFDGSDETFKDLPKVNSTSKMQKVYDRIEKIQGK